MHFDATTFLTALGLAFVFEGLPYFLFAERMPAFLARMAATAPGQLRLTGLLAMALGLGLILLVRS